MVFDGCTCDKHPTNPTYEVLKAQLEELDAEIEAERKRITVPKLKQEKYEKPEVIGGTLIEIHNLMMQLEYLKGVLMEFSDYYKVDHRAE